MSTTKIEVTNFKGSQPVRYKITIFNSIPEQVSSFKYLGCDKSYETKYNVNTKIHQFQATCNTINTALKKKCKEINKVKTLYGNGNHHSFMLQRILD